MDLLKSCDKMMLTFFLKENLETWNYLFGEGLSFVISLEVERKILESWACGFGDRLHTPLEIYRKSWNPGSSGLEAGFTVHAFL